LTLLALVDHVARHSRPRADRSSHEGSSTASLSHTVMAATTAAPRAMVAARVVRARASGASSRAVASSARSSVPTAATRNAPRASPAARIAPRSRAAPRAALLGDQEVREEPPIRVVRTARLSLRDAARRPRIDAIAADRYYFGGKKSARRDSSDEPIDRPPRERIAIAARAP
jgi:hypothetical protein